jgi:hypothetical protein
LIEAQHRRAPVFLMVPRSANRVEWQIHPVRKIWRRLIKRMDHPVQREEAPSLLPCGPRAL